MNKLISTALLSLLCLSGTASAQALQIKEDDAGSRYGWIGPLPKKPMPAVLILGSTIENNLTDASYIKAIEPMCKKVFCVTVDGPGEGGRDGAYVALSKTSGGLSFWAKQLDTSGNFVSGRGQGEPMWSFIARARLTLDRLHKMGVIDRNRTGVFGISRGAFAAFHLGAEIPVEFKGIAAFSPVTNLETITEFAQVKPAARAFTVESQKKFAEKLYETPIWISIGASDDRVGTKNAVDFAQMMRRAATEKGAKPLVELQVKPADGHHVPDGAYEEASRWMLGRLGVK